MKLYFQPIQTQTKKISENARNLFEDFPSAIITVSGIPYEILLFSTNLQFYLKMQDFLYCSPAIIKMAGFLEESQFAITIVAGNLYEILVFSIP